MYWIILLLKQYILSICLQIGINPGLLSAHLGHHYCNANNHFCKFIFVTYFSKGTPSCETNLLHSSVHHSAILYWKLMKLGIQEELFLDAWLLVQNGGIKLKCPFSKIAIYRNSLSFLYLYFITITN